MNNNTLMNSDTPTNGNAPMQQSLDEVLQQRIIETADEYHYIGESQWQDATAVEPINDELVFEFRRMIRAALVYYVRAYLVLDLIETDDEQQLENLLEIVTEQQPELAEFMAQNDVLAVLDEESDANVSHVFSVAEAMRSALLELSNGLAATLASRFPAG